MLPLLTALVVAAPMPDLEQVALNSSYQYFTSNSSKAVVQQKPLIDAVRAAGERAVKGLVRLTESPSWRLRSGALIALVDAAPQALSDAMMSRALDDPDTGWAAALAAGRSDRRSLLPKLYSVAERDLGTLIFATWAIGRMDPQGCEGYMKRVLSTSFATVKAKYGIEFLGVGTATFAATALADLGERGRDALIGLVDAELSDAREAVCEALGRFDAPAVHEALKSRLDDGNSQVRDEALTALCRLKDPDRRRFAGLENPKRYVISKGIPLRFVDEVGPGFYAEVMKEHEPGSPLSLALWWGGERGYAHYRAFQPDVYKGTKIAVLGFIAARDAEETLAKYGGDGFEARCALAFWTDADLRLLRERSKEFPLLASLLDEPAALALREGFANARWAYARLVPPRGDAELRTQTDGCWGLYDKIRTVWRDNSTVVPGRPMSLSGLEVARQIQSDWPKARTFPRP